jgi:hypothetical protein
MDLENEKYWDLLMWKVSLNRGDDKVDKLYLLARGVSEIEKWIDDNYNGDGTCIKSVKFIQNMDGLIIPNS